MTVRLNQGLPSAALNDRSGPLRLLETRRSASVKELTGPGPSAAEIERLLAVASRVPDHGKLTPWRFILFEGEARAAAGEVLAARHQALHPDHSPATLDQQRATFERAPVVIAVISVATPHPKIPEWEQVLSAGAACQSLVTAAIAMGYGAQWVTEWYGYDREVCAAFGIAEAERVAGFVYVGTPAAPLSDRPRPEPDSLLTRWSGPA